jgi:hypothetical protein
MDIELAMTRTEYTGGRKDNRHAPRRKADADAWIRIGGFAVRRCVIADVSVSGVRLIIGGSIHVPREFELMTARDAKAGRKCQIKWRNSTQIGAAFL